MRWETITVCAVCVLGLVAAIPVPQSDYEVSQSQGQVPLDVQERLHTLQLDDSAIEQVARDKRTIAVLRQLFPGISQQTELNPEDENQVIGAESQQNEVRLLPENAEQDQELAASGGNDAPDPANVEVASDDSASEDSDRNKRLINFSLGGGASSSGGSGGGSGNFLFDIIRLVAGSGNTESSGDAGAGAGAERDDGYQAGIPGPITRLFVIANRGIANLIQDLILRIAQTSERIVNYKARLITAII